MPKWMTVAFALFLSLQVFSTEGRDVDAVIGNCVKAMGGKGSIHSVYAEGVCKLSNGKKTSFSMYKLDGKLFYAEISSGNAKVVFTSKKGWKTGGADIPRDEIFPFEAVKMLQTEPDCSGSLVDYDLKGHKAELIGQEVVAGKDCFLIRLTLNSGQEVDYYIDSASWLIVRKTSNKTFIEYKKIELNKPLNSELYKP